MIANGTFYNESRMSGLIFISDNDITSQKTYSHPELIARVPSIYEEGLSALTFQANQSNHYEVRLEHKFVEYCYVFDSLIPIIEVTVALYFIVILIWVYVVYMLRKEQAFPVQKILTMLPILKMIESLLVGADYNKCPWDSADIAEDAYIKMGKVTLITFTYTFLHALLYMLCKGWNTTNQAVDRNQATNLTLVMGLMYLMYSAYFLSSEILGMKSIIDSVLSLLYFFLGLANFRSLH